MERKCNEDLDVGLEFLVVHVDRIFGAVVADFEQAVRNLYLQQIVQHLSLGLSATN